MGGLAMSAVWLVMFSPIALSAPGGGGAEGPHDETVAQAAALALHGAPHGTPHGSWQERRHWDWGQHRLFATDQRPPLAPPRLQPEDEGWPGDHWDDPGAPVRIAVPTPQPILR